MEITKEEDDDDVALCVNLPAHAGCDEKVPRVVDGTCALCLDEYKEGDVVVWSDLNCPHAFHKECIVSVYNSTVLRFRFA